MGVRPFLIGRALAFTALCGLLSCGPGSVLLSPADLDSAYAKARFNEEVALAETCSALDKAWFSPAIAAGAGVLMKDELARRLAVLLEAARLRPQSCTDDALRGLIQCRSGQRECSQDARKCDQSLRTKLASNEQAKPGLLSSIGYSVDPRADPKLAAVLGARALSSDPAGVARQINLSFATVMTLVGLARQADTWADDLSGSFGWFQGMARPLLKLAAAEIVAASLDNLVGRLEAEQSLSKAAVSAQACELYHRADTSSLVVSRMLRRAILRFSARDYSAVSEAAKACAELDRAAHRAGRGDSVCRQMLSKSTGRPQSDLTGLALHQPTADGRRAPFADPEQAKLLRVAAERCLSDHEGGTESCPLGRVQRIASVLALSDSKMRPSDLSALPFPELERGLLALESQVSQLGHGVESVNTELGVFRSEQQRSIEALSATQDRIEQEITLLERRLVRDTLIFASRAGRACRQYVEQVLTARDEVAQALQLRDEHRRSVEHPCAHYDELSPAAGDQRYLSAAYPGIEARRESLCGGRFVELSAVLSYESGALLPKPELATTLDWLSKTVAAGDSVSIVAYGDDALPSRELNQAFDALTGEVKQRFLGRTRPSDKLAILRAQRTAERLPTSSASLSIGGNAAHRIELSALLGGPLAFDPIAHCPPWPPAQ
ncbi:MAG TPA: hypothetical protein VGJ84_23530 [Polyangiaceae bacterium]